jgi:hypothetical protein
MFYRCAFSPVLVKMLLLVTPRGQRQDFCLCGLYSSSANRETGARRTQLVDQRAGTMCV